MKVAVALLLSAMILAGCAASPGQTTTSTSTTTTTPTTSSTPVTSTPAPSADVVIKLFAFEPANLTKAVGAKVVWRNDDEAAHTVTADDGTFDSGNVAAGGTFEFTGAKDATIPYHCKIHATMKGTLVVGAGTTPPTTTPTTPTNATPTTPTTPAQTQASASIQAFMFDPNPLNVKVNTNVTWTNDESLAPHTVTADDNSFTSANLDPGAKYSHLFTVAGTYAYHCKLHSFMKATVVVTA